MCEYAALLPERLGQDELLLETVERIADAKGHSFEWHVSKDAEHSRDIAKRLASASGFDGLIAVGGDGTLNCVASGIIDSGNGANTALGIVPRGTGNDLARVAGLDRDRLEEAVHTAFHGPSSAIDAASLGDGQYFVNALSLGIGAEATAATPPALKDVLGTGAYSLMAFLLAAVRTPSRARFEIDETVWEGEYLAAAIGNGAYAGGGYEICPGAAWDDGLLDLTIFPKVDQENIAAMIEELAGESTKDDGGIVLRRRAKRIAIESSVPLRFNADGEPCQAERIEVRVLPGALRVRHAA
ncbi:MAG: hypothetical protein PWP23_1701 [Candidatus Sumerlaeota bacterium]|nr:hypothetical protein [Candidatus Sumerlaeota bacterium]